MKIILILTLTMILAGCAPSEERRSSKIPHKILSIGQMAAVIADIQIAEGLLREKRNTGQNTDLLTVEYMAGILEKHNITMEKYQESINFYEKNLDLYEQVYDQVITLLTQKKTELTVPH